MQQKDSTASMAKIHTCAACGTMFLANWHIQAAWFLLMVKELASLSALSPPRCRASLGVIKNGTLNLFRIEKAIGGYIKATSIFAALYLGNPGSSLLITMMSTISEVANRIYSQKKKEYIHSVMKS